MIRDDGGGGVRSFGIHEGERFFTRERIDRRLSLLAKGWRFKKKKKGAIPTEGDDGR